MGQVNYNDDLFKVINELTPITNIIGIQKKGVDNVISFKNSTMGALIKFKKEIWDHDEEVIIGDFNEFNQILRQVKEPQISIDNYINIKNDTVSINYAPSDRDIVDARAIYKTDFVFGEEGAVWYMSENDIKQAKNLIGLLLGVKKIEMNSVKSKVHIKVKNNKVILSFSKSGGRVDSEISGNSFKMEFNLKTNIDKEYEYFINPGFFVGIPVNDYRFALKPNSSKMKIIKAESINIKKDDEVMCESMFISGVFK